MYTAIVLSKESRELLESRVERSPISPSEWETLCHHVTICMGRNKKYPFTLGEEVVLEVVALGVLRGYDIPNDKRPEKCGLGGWVCFAAMVTLPKGKYIKNSVPHVTMAVNRSVGGKPVHSNLIRTWDYDDNMANIKLVGTVQECE